MAKVGALAARPRSYGKRRPTARDQRLTRRKTMPGSKDFAPGDLRDFRLVTAGSDDPQIMGVALEAFLQAIVERLEPDGKSPLFRKTQQIIKEKEEKASGT